jgi:hypothetical protein
VDEMLAPAQASDHRARFGPVARLAERFAVQVDHRVGRDDQIVAGGCPVGLAARMGACEVPRREMRERPFIVRRGDDVDDQTQRGEQLAAARRRAGQSNAMQRRNDNTLILWRAYAQTQANREKSLVDRRLRVSRYRCVACRRRSRDG